MTIVSALRTVVLGQVPTIYGTPIDLPNPVWPQAGPDSVLNYTGDATATLLDVSDSFSEVSVSVSPSGAGELVCNSVSVGGGVITTVLGPGFPGRLYTVKIEGTTTAGLTFEWFVNLSLTAPFPFTGGLTPPPSTGYGTPVTWEAPGADSGSYVVSGFTGATPLGANQVIFGHQFTAAVKFPANFGATPIGTLSQGGCLVAASGTTAISIQQALAASDPTSPGSWVTVGTMTVSAAGHTVAFATSGAAAQSFAQGDFMRWVGPATPDPTMANLFASLAATRA